MADGRLGNSFTLHIENRAKKTRSFHIRLEQDKAFELITGLNPITIDPISAAGTRVFVVPREADQNGLQFDTLQFILEPLDGEHASIARESRFVTPGVSNDE